MNLIIKDDVNTFFLNISNEVDFDFYTMSIESAEYNVDITLVPPSSPNNRSISFSLTEGIDFDLPNNGDYNYHITNTQTEGSTTGNVIFRGVMRLKEPQETIISYNAEDTTVIYE